MWLFAQTHLWGAMINFQAFVHLPHPDSRAWIWSYKNRHKHNLRPKFTALACKRLQNILDTHCAWLVSPAASPGCCPRHTHTHWNEKRMCKQVAGHNIWHTWISFAPLLYLCLSLSALFPQVILLSSCRSIQATTAVLLFCFVLTDKFATSLPK